MAQAKKPKLVSIREREFEEREPPSERTHRFIFKYRPARRIIID